MKFVGRMVRQLLTSAVHEPVTTHYPAVKLNMPERFRGKINYFADKCIGCKICMRDCPSAAIVIRKVGEKLFEADFDLSKCIYCAQCVDSCPKKALEATKDFELAQLKHDTLRITYHAEPKPAPPAEQPTDVKPQDGPAKTA
jgi:formate hydrogenlyase subunit 6/NADH:ubiquinone oxidoreductase subunit I